MPVFPPLSRAYKSQPYLPQGKNRKRKRSQRCPFEVRPSRNGVGMFATRLISCGDIIVANEDPIVHCGEIASSSPEPRVCNACATPIGSLRDNHLMVPSSEEDLILPYLDDGRGLVFTTSSDIITTTCQTCEEAAWCSRECHQKELLQHAVVCSSTSLTDFYNARENPIIFRLATQSITLILSHLASLPKEEQHPIQRFFWWKDYGSHPLWWEVGSSRGNKEVQATEFCNVLRGVLMEAVIQKRVEVDRASILQICTLENVGSILGMLQCNVMDMNVHPRRSNTWNTCKKYSRR